MQDEAAYPFADTAKGQESDNERHGEGLPRRGGCLGKALCFARFHVPIYW